MSKIYHCANCGQRLTVYRKAMPKYGRVLDLVDPHTCTEEPVELDLSPIDVPTFVPQDTNNKFVKKLNELQPPPLLVPNKELHDRRPADQVKSSAPESLISHIRDLSPTTPAHNITDEPKPD